MDAKFKPLNNLENDDIDHETYKGIYHNEPEEGVKYFDSVTGAHFKFSEIYDRLTKIAKEYSNEEESSPTIQVKKQLSNK
jgi:hypothetical protein